MKKEKDIRKKKKKICQYQHQLKYLKNYNLVDSFNEYSVFKIGINRLNWNYSVQIVLYMAHKKHGHGY
jgi:hypothetical protein